MPTPAPRTSQGNTIGFGTSGFTARITSFDGPNYSRDALETTYLGSTVAKEFIPNDLYDPGEISLEIQYDPQIADPPIGGAVEVVTITYASGATRSGSGFVTAFQPKASVGSLQTASITVKCTGAWTRSG